MKRGRDYSSDSSDDSQDENEEEEENVLDQEIIASHPWGVKPRGNQYFDGGNAEEVREGLGSFVVLDDATMVLVLSMLSAKDLARTGMSSRAMVVFCDHEPLWKDLLLKELGGNWSWRGNYRDTYVHEVYGGGGHVPFLVKGFYSDFLNKSWLCATAKFNRTWIGAETIPRERACDLSVEDFIRKYEQPNQPVIITGLIDDWPLYKHLNKWIDEHKDSMVKVGNVVMKMENFLNYSKEALDEDPLYLFHKKCGDLLEGQYKVPEYWSKERDLFSLMPSDQRPDYRWVIAGGSCSGSPFHIGFFVVSFFCFFFLIFKTKDPNGTSAWNAVLSGRKKWVLAPKKSKIPGLNYHLCSFFIFFYFFKRSSCKC